MTKSPEELITTAEEQKELARNNIRNAADWFHDREGNMIERGEAVDELIEEFNVSEEIANILISELVGDLVDPVVQVVTPDGRFVGVIDYVEGNGWYGYTDYDDILGEAKTVVCAQCVHEAEYDNEVTHAKENTGSFGDAEYNELAAAVLQHYDNAHNQTPEDVTTGADLISPTTIGNNTAWHDGNVSGGSNVSIGSTDVSLNQGSGSGLDADTVDGNHASELGADEAKEIEREIVMRM